MQKWQTCWESFIEFLNDELSASRPVDEIADELSGQLVEWVGTLSEKRFNAVAWRVKVQLPPRALIVAGNRATQPIRSISIPVHGDDVDRWNESPEGSVIKFHARFVTGAETPFRALTITQFDDGSAFAILRFAAGQPICIVPDRDA